MEKVLRGSTPSNTTPRNRSFLAMSGRMKPKLPFFSASETTTSAPWIKSILTSLCSARKASRPVWMVATGMAHFGFSTTNTPFFSAETNG